MADVTPACPAPEEVRPSVEDPCAVLKRLFRDEQRLQHHWVTLGEKHSTFGELAEARWRSQIRAQMELHQLAEEAGCDLLALPEEEAESA